MDWRREQGDERNKRGAGERCGRWFPGGGKWEREWGKGRWQCYCEHMSRRRGWQLNDKRMRYNIVVGDDWGELAWLGCCQWVVTGEMCERKEVGTGRCGMVNRWLWCYEEWDDGDNVMTIAWFNDSTAVMWVWVYQCDVMNNGVSGWYWLCECEWVIWYWLGWCNGDSVKVIEIRSLPISRVLPPTQFVNIVDEA